MRKIIPILLIIGGLSVAGWNGYVWAKESKTGKEKLAPEEIELEGWENRDYIDVIDSENAAAVDEADEEPTDIKETDGEETEEIEERSYEEYDRGDKIGELLIPAVDSKYPVYWGTDDETLEKGVGYHDGDFTTPPDGYRHTVLSGHRDTVFRELGDLDDGDRIYMNFEDVQYEYQIRKTWITEADDRSVIVDKEAPTLTLTTCYPFNYLGSAPDRYIIEAELVETSDRTE
ncbi:class D sortase [Alteribacillus sp. HJP-4]|uniref:class D sortase n=1 Tax=Alteribacillus sp. HJP-4 TaxID=2775394 RepID=UPI0035CD05DE